MKAYKAFDRQLKCRGFQYKEGETHLLGLKPILCTRGFHFCKELVLTLNYYDVKDSVLENKYAEVEILGDIVYEEPNRHKGVTNKIKILRVLSDKEVLAILDKGWHNSGHYNSGHYNSGCCNSGHYNSGDSNSGNRNSGDHNSGEFNSGDYNSGDSNSGFFNTNEPTHVRTFEKEVELDIWKAAYKPAFLRFQQEENETYKEAFKRSWDEADPLDRVKVMLLPNFDTEIFYKISGIDLRSSSNG